MQCYFPPAPGRRRRDINDDIDAVTMGVSNTIAVVRQCPFGLFWSQQTRTCEQASIISPAEDECNGSRSRTRSSNNCRGYYACVGRRSVPNCCPMGYAYSKVGCVVCPGCIDSCSSVSAARTYACVFRPVWNDPTSFERYRLSSDGEGSYVAQQCPDNTYFNLASCDCVPKPWRAENETVCGPRLDIPNFAIRRSEFTSENIQLTNLGQAVLDGSTSKLRINLDGNADFANYGGPLVIQFRYKESEEIVSRQALLSSPDCPRAGFLLITVDRESILMEVTTDGGLLTTLKLPTAGFKPDEWKTLRVVDNNDYISLMVSDGEDGYVTRTRAPASPYVQCGLDLGSANFVNGFKGQIEQFTFYQCIPTNIVG
ncbi:protein PIF [Aplysia californica]|uniref:Protein PIF n=1 Tax=Aplysia californica TaxID=6500 RepID=A0ABM0ZXP0_APLCA|nr:protein PIF [Aplysia californica]